MHVWSVAQDADGIEVGNMKADLWQVYRSAVDPNRSILFIPGILTEDATVDTITSGSLSWIQSSGWKGNIDYLHWQSGTSCEKREFRKRIETAFSSGKKWTGHALAFLGVFGVGCLRWATLRQCAENTATRQLPIILGAYPKASRITIIAHSMGVHLLNEYLEYRYLYRILHPRIEAIILMGGATKHNRKWRVDSAMPFFNVYNQRDHVLRYPYGLVNLTFMREEPCGRKPIPASILPSPNGRNINATDWAGGSHSYTSYGKIFVDRIIYYSQSKTRWHAHEQVCT